MEKLGRIYIGKGPKIQANYILAALKQIGQHFFTMFNTLDLDHFPLIEANSRCQDREETVLSRMPETSRNAGAIARAEQNFAISSPGFESSPMNLLSSPIAAALQGFQVFLAETAFEKAALQKAMLQKAASQKAAF